MNKDGKDRMAWLHSESTMNVYTVILAVICVVIAIIFFVNRSASVGLIFLGIAALLTAVFVISVKLEQRDHEKSNNKSDNKRRKGK